MSIPFLEDKDLSRHLAGLQPQQQQAPQRRPETKHMNRVFGTVRHFNPEREYGFCRPDDASLPDCFIGKISLSKAGLRGLERGDRLEFRVVPSRNRPGDHEAHDLRLIERAAA